MKSVLISIQPKWCELIASGKKTVEVRKTRPKIDTPFKCYIYCTKAKDYFSIGGGVYAANDELYRLPTGEIKFGDSFELVADWSGHYNGDNLLNGKVIGEFVCDRVQPFESEFVDDDCYENIAGLDYDEDGDVTGFIEWSNDSDFPYESTDFYKKCCVKYEELKKYIGIGINQFYAWHISDLVIYDKPRELREFYTVCKLNCEHCEMWGSVRVNAEEFDIDCKSDWFNHKPLTRPPQSWCYVELLKGGAE